jgi:3-phosphoinositide dependent protein kinase-1
LQGHPAGFASDLWSLGCVVYTLLTGKPAFRGASEYLTFQKIIKREFEYPPDFPDVAKEFVDSLLNLDPSKRLGAYPSGFSEIKSHPFFDGIDFEKINVSAAPAFRMSETLDPNIKNPEVTIHFQDEKNFESPKASIVSDGKQIRDPYAKWKRFLLVDEEILKCGYVMKRRGLFSKRRMLILTHLPRFVYIDPQTMEKKGEISWSNSLWAEMKNESTFNIHTPNRTYYMQAQDIGAREWVDAINNLIIKK